MNLSSLGKSSIVHIERFMNKHPYVIFQHFIVEKYQSIFISIYSKNHFNSDSLELINNAFPILLYDSFDSRDQ